MPWPEVSVGNKNHANTAVVIIGGGVSGVCMAIDLIKRTNCRNFIVVEKSAGLGGTWYLSSLRSFLLLRATNWRQVG